MLSFLVGKSYAHSKAYILVLLSILLLSVDLSAQDAKGSYRKLTSMDVFQKHLKDKPELQKELDKIESNIEEFVQKGKTKKATIPLVFHVIHNGEEGYISERQIADQITALNRDFSLAAYKIAHQADTLEGFSKLKPKKMDIDFCLAELKQNSQNKSPVIYHETTKSEWSNEGDIKSARNGGSSPLDTDSYVNIWIAKLDSTTSGYAQLPGMNKETDGIVIDYRYFGIQEDNSRYGQGKTLTHLVGNYLGLYDLWGPSYCADDGVEDTPIHNAPNYICPDYKHVTTCEGNRVEMTMNFMDNSDDECLRMFTIGQMLRIHAVIDKDGPRGNLRKTKTQCGDDLGDNFVDVGNVRNEGSSDIGSLELYPNPTHTFVNLVIRSPETNVPFTYKVHDISGKVVLTDNVVLNNDHTVIRVDVNNLTPGTYFLKGAFSRDHTVTKQFVVIQD